jgi:hypothetical protein
MLESIDAVKLQLGSDADAVKLQLGCTSIEMLVSVHLMSITRGWRRAASEMSEQEQEAVRAP